MLSKLLNKAVVNRSIGYHPMCCVVNLTHLSFADDIVVFTDGSPASLNGTLAVFQEFERMSGLRINVSKSTVFAAGRGKHELEVAAGEVGLTVSALPIKYFGLPLTTKTMTRHDYEPLLVKIRNRLLSWTSKILSFAGRLQLIKSVIASITNFWCSAFCLPQSFIDEIDSMCAAFLWSESPNITTRAKVAWEGVCSLKKEGGLGVRRIKDVSLVFALKLIWRLFTDSESLWGKWVKQTFLRGISFWDVREASTGSWVWKKLLQLRPVAQKLLKMDIHDGKLVKFSTYIWHPIGRLIEIVGDCGGLKLGVDNRACIADVLVGNVWRFRQTRDTNVQNMITKVKELHVELETNVHDGVLWKRREDEYGREFSTVATWEQIRCRRPTVAWSKLIWFAFISWLAVKDRLST